MDVRKVETQGVQVTVEYGAHGIPSITLEFKTGKALAAFKRRMLLGMDSSGNPFITGEAHDLDAQREFSWGEDVSVANEVMRAFRSTPYKRSAFDIHAGEIPLNGC